MVIDGIRINTVKGPGTHIVLNLEEKTVYIPGFEGSNLDLKLDPSGDWLVPSDSYFTDNYDSHLALVEEVTEVDVQTSNRICGFYRSLYNNIKKDLK